MGTSCVTGAHEPLVQDVGAAEGEGQDETCVAMLTYGPGGGTTHLLNILYGRQAQPEENMLKLTPWNVRGRKYVTA